MPMHELAAPSIALRDAPSGKDPWDGRTLEWSPPTPPPEYNYDVIPVIQSRDDFWFRKHPRTPGPLRPDPKAEAGTASIHMPSQSWFPFLTAVAILVAGLFFAHHNMAGALAGLALVILSTWLWSLEGPGGYQLQPKPETQ